MVSLLEVIFDTWGTKNNPYLSEVASQYRRAQNVVDGLTPPSVYDPSSKWGTVYAAHPQAELSALYKIDVPEGELAILNAVYGDRTLSWFNNKTEQWCSRNDG